MSENTSHIQDTGRLYAKVCKDYVSTIKFLGDKNQIHEFLTYIGIQRELILNYTEMAYRQIQWPTHVTWVYTQTHSVALLNSVLRAGGEETKRQCHKNKTHLTLKDRGNSLMFRHTLIH